jgi:hypothetical protein
MLENQTFLAPLLPFWEKRRTELVEVGLGDEGRILVYVFAPTNDRERHRTLESDDRRHSSTRDGTGQRDFRKTLTT